ncbi:protein kinase domain-containing protein [Actinomyces wuliandei]|uniref:protein kinase domain-containing protein n=1 Tax=Actinomyces wuliandei TaxID=2057743 RepID=UPI00214CBA1D|nr:protein kinase [Actinomyces wuliandei]
MTRDRNPRRRRAAGGTGARVEGAPRGEPPSAQALQALAAEGFTIGSVLGGRAGASPPRRCVDPQGRDVVLRVLPLPEGAGGAALLRRLAGLRSLRHRALVAVRHVVALPSHHVGVAVDLVDGVSLDVVLAARGRLPTPQLALLLDELGSALAHLHEHGCAHGDVSTGNVVVTAEGRPVLIDLLGSVMETGTGDCAAPERRSGGPATPTADVYALAALIRQCAGGGASGGAGYRARRVEQLLADALSSLPEDRPGARDLAARSPQLGQARGIDLPDSARLAAGSLRAAAHTPTRVVGARLRQRRPRWYPLPASGRAGRAGRRGPWPRRGHGASRGRGRHRASRRGGGVLTVARTSRLLCVVTVAAAAVAVLVLQGPGGALGGHLPSRAGDTATAAPPGAAAAGSDQGSWPAASPPVQVSQEATREPPQRADTAPPPEGQRGTAREGAEQSLVSVVVSLAAARDQALMDGDEEALAATTVPGSPAAAADEQIMRDLLASGETVTDMTTSVSQIVEVEVPAGTTWPGARAVVVTQSQAPSSRASAGTRRTVPAQAARQVVLILVPQPWRVAEVRSYEL